MKITEEEIEALLSSDDQEKLEEWRRLEREKITSDTLSIVEFFLSRQASMWRIARSKRKLDGILKLDREYELINKFSEMFEKAWEDSRMAEMLIWLLTAAWKEKQRKILERDSVFVKENLSQEELLDNLLSLTSLVAEKYENYWEWFSATKLAMDLEKDMLVNLINSIESKDLSIDLWSSNWKITKLIKENWFNRVDWYDVSSDMIRVAQEINSADWVNYIEHNLLNWIPNKSESVNLVVSNFGAASEVNKDIFSEVSRILKPWWKAFLSFYNEDAISNDWWQPWQWSLEAVINTEDDIVEVPIIEKNGDTKTFKIFAKSLSYKDIPKLIDWKNLELDYVASHSSLSAMMSPMFFDDEKRAKQAVDFEVWHSKTAPYIWFYLTVVLTKK